jgi:hypothetical protein
MFIVRPFGWIQQVQTCFFPLVPRIQLGTAQQSSEPNGEARVFVRIFLYIYFVMIFEK